MTPEQDQRLKEIAEEVEAIRSDPDDDMKPHAEKYLVELYDLLQSIIAERDEARELAELMRDDIQREAGEFLNKWNDSRMPWEKDAT